MLRRLTVKDSIIKSNYTKLDKPQVGDKVYLIQGHDRGRTGIVKKDTRLHYPYIILSNKKQIIISPEHLFKIEL